MAFSVKRGVAIVVVGWAALVAAYLPPGLSRAQDEFWVRTDGEIYRLNRPNRLYNRLRDETAALQMLEHRDHVLSAIVSQPHASLPVWVDRTIPAPRAARLRFIAESTFRAAGIAQAKVPVGVGFVTDSIQRSSIVHYLLPTRASEPCLVIVPFHDRAWVNKDGDALIHSAAYQLPGPCALYARFGLPGAGVRQWMARGGGELAVTKESLLRPAAPDTPFDVLRSFLEEPVDGYTGLGCRRGDARRCAALISDATLVRPHPWAHDRIPGWNGGDGLAVSYAASHWFADLETREGADKLARFWHSDEPLDAAFATAFGSSLGTWTARWVASYPQNDYRAVTTPSVWVSVVIGLLLIAASVETARRRQVRD